MRHRLIQRRLSLMPPLSREQLALAVNVHPKTMARIERGESNPRPDTRAAMCVALGCSAAELALALTDDAPEIPSDVFRAPTTGLDMLAMLERTCRQLRTLELAVVPGLLQTEAYANAVESLAPGSPGPDQIARNVGERLARQEALTKSDPLQLFAVLDPSILTDTVGGPDVMAEQVAHLRDMNTRPNVSLRLLNTAGRIAGSNGPWKLLTGDDAAPFMLVSEDLSGGLSYRGGHSVDVHQARWAFIWERGSDALA